MQKVNMTDKNGKEITIGAHCIIDCIIDDNTIDDNTIDDNKIGVVKIGVVKNIINDKVSVLLLSDDGETCLEKTISGDCIDIR